jgi:phage portal protein BeeE
LIETGGEIEEIKILMVNQGLNYINSKPWTILKKADKFGVPIKVHQGLNCIKSKVYDQLRVQLSSIDR